MPNKLQEKWGVSARQFWIIFIAFALTGTTTAALTRYITAWLGMDAGTFWLWKVLLRVGMLILGYQFILLAYGALLGQWAFFWKYERKLLVKLRILKNRGEAEYRTPNRPVGGAGKDRQSEDGEDDGDRYSDASDAGEKFKQGTGKQEVKLAIFASGAGTNAGKIIEHLKNHPYIKVSLIVCNKPGAGVISLGLGHEIPVLMIEKHRFFQGDGHLPDLRAVGINFIVLAGFLWKVPDSLIKAFPRRIINIHPALLPAYGGKGMYGMKVHEAVIAAGEKESGITIHYVNENFDEGEHIFQSKYTLKDGETPESLAEQIHVLEHMHFPGVVVDVVEVVSGK